MAPSGKRKRKPLPKRPCPCCGSILSEKTIERHSSGSHVPTQINVTLAAAAAQKRTNVDVFSDLYEDFSGYSTDSTERDSTDSPEFPVPQLKPQLQLDPKRHRELSVDWNPAEEEDYDVEKDDGNSRMLDDILQKSWAECRPQVDEDESDEEGDSSESDEGRESGSEWGGEGIYNGLGRDDLIEEDLQRLIAEFGAHICISWFDIIL